MDPSASSVDKPRRWARKAGQAAAGNGAAEGAANSNLPADGITTEPPPPPSTASSTRRGKGKGKPGTESLYPYPPSRGSGPGTGRGGALRVASEPFAAGVRSAYSERYAAELNRLQARRDLPAAARWLDSHCHLESILQRSWRGGGKPQVTENEPVVALADLVESWPAGLDGCICVCAFRRPSKPGFPSEWQWIETNLLHFGPESPIGSKLWFTIGIHPHDAKNWDAAADETVRRLGAHPKCVGIGECGLDFFKHDQDEAELQLKAFRGQAALAVELKKALVVHARLTSKANEDMFLHELSEAVPSEHPIHIHCYSDSLSHAQDLIKRFPNLRIGFTGAITFRDKSGKAKAKGKEAKGGEKKGEAHCRELIQGLPLDRLLIETDGPYMCPDPFRGQTAHPGFVHLVAERIAEWKDVPLGHVMDATRKNTATVYGV